MVKPNLAKFVNDSEDDWDLYLQMGISAYNNSYNSSIGMSPYEARFGIKPTLLADVIMNNGSNEVTSQHLGDFIVGLKSAAEHIQKVVEFNKDLAHSKQKEQYDKRAQASAFFKVGDLVKINNFRIRPGRSKAFERKFIGPYKIVALCNEFNYELTAPDKRRELVHYNRMSHYYARDEIECILPQEFNRSSYKQGAISKTVNKPLQMSGYGYYNIISTQARLRRSKKNATTDTLPDQPTSDNVDLAPADPTLDRDQRAARRNAQREGDAGSESEA